MTTKIRGLLAALAVTAVACAPSPLLHRDGSTWRCPNLRPVIEATWPEHEHRTWDRLAFRESRCGADQIGDLSPDRGAWQVNEIHEEMLAANGLSWYALADMGNEYDDARAAELVAQQAAVAGWNRCRPWSARC